MTWRVYPPTPENRDLIKKYVLVRPRANVIGEDVLDFLLANPISRVSASWREKWHSGLSPFAMAGVVRHPPSAVLDRIKKVEQYFQISYCGNTMLPILFDFGGLPWSVPRKRGFYNSYDEDFVHDERFTWVDEDKWCFDSMMKRYGGENWKRHCTRGFDPRGQGAVLTTAEWESLKLANTLGLPARAVRRD